MKMEINQTVQNTIKNNKIMTANELINRLNTVQDKTKDVVFPYEFGTNEMGEPLDVTCLIEMMDCVIIG